MNIKKLEKIWGNEVYQNKNQRLRINVSDKEKNNYYYGNEITLLKMHETLSIQGKDTNINVRAVERLFGYSGYQSFELNIKELGEAVKQLLSRRKKDDVFIFDIANNDLIVNYKNNNKEYKLVYSAFYSQEKINNESLKIQFVINRKYIQNVIKTSEAFGVEKINVKVLSSISNIIFYSKDNFEIVVAPIKLA